MSSGSEDRRSPIASRRPRPAAAAAAERSRRGKAKRDRRSPSYLSLRDRDRDRDVIGRRDHHGGSRSRSRSPSPRRSRSRSPSRRRARRYFDDQADRRSRSRSPSPRRRSRRARSDDSYRDDEEEPDRRGRGSSPGLGGWARTPPRSCRSRSRTRSEECEDSLCCRRSRSRSPAAGDADDRERERSLSPVPEDEDFYVRIDRPDDLFKCSRCFEHLSSPVYECVDGHVTCAVCHGSTNGDEGVDDTCGRCGSTDYRRSRAVAGWLRSVWFPCRNHDHGCPAFLPRHKMGAHERSCLYAPVFCPVGGRHFCDFPGGPTDALERHVTAAHGWTVAGGVRYGQPFHVRVRPGPSSRSLIRAEDDGALFHLCARAVDHGGAAVVSMIRIRPDDEPAPAAEFTYEVKTPAVAGMQHRIQMQSTVWGTSLRDGVLYANPVSVKVPGDMMPRDGPEQDSVEVRILKVAPPPAGDRDNNASNN